MTMTINEKKALYAFGCPNRECTVKRFAMLASLAPDPAAKRFFIFIARKLNTKDADRWYRCCFYKLRLEMEAYFSAEKCMERVKVSSLHEENAHEAD